MLKAKSQKAKSQKASKNSDTKKKQFRALRILNAEFNFYKFLIIYKIKKALYITCKTSPFWRICISITMKI